MCIPHLRPLALQELVRLFDLLEQADAAALSSLPSSAAAIPSVRDAGAWKRFCIGLTPGPPPGDGVASPHEEGAQEGHPREASGGSEAAADKGNEKWAQNVRDTVREDRLEGTTCQPVDEQEGVQSSSKEEGGWQGAQGENPGDGGKQEAGPTEETAAEGGATPSEGDTGRSQATAGADAGTSSHQTAEMGSWQAGSDSSRDPRRNPSGASPAATGSREGGEGETQGSGGMQGFCSLGAGAPSEVDTVNDEAARDASGQGADIVTKSPPSRRARRSEALLEGVMPFLGILLRLDQVRPDSGRPAGAAVRHKDESRLLTAGWDWPPSHLLASRLASPPCLQEYVVTGLCAISAGPSAFSRCFPAHLFPPWCPFLSRWRSRSTCGTTCAGCKSCPPRPCWTGGAARGCLRCAPLWASPWTRTRRPRCATCCAPLRSGGPTR